MAAREETCLAAEQHDIGMAEWDRRPTLNPETGLPHSFMEMPLATHLELWSHAAGKLVRQSAYAALLVSMHGTALYEMRDLERMDEAETGAVRAFLADRRDEQDELLAQLGETRDAVGPSQRLIWTWDFMSLALCLDWAPTETEGVGLEPDGAWRVTVDPWPFAGEALTVRCEGRRLDGPFADEDAMRAALDAAPIERLEWELRPL
jgi:hypothetical protein